jgi:hypothetical protein
METPVTATVFNQFSAPALKSPSTMSRIPILLAAAMVVISASGAFASQLVLNSTGGSMSIGASFVVTGATVTSPAGTISINCPITSVLTGTYLITYNCSGGNFSYQSSDGTTSVSARFGTAAAYLSASGGGRGGNIHYYYSFSGNFTGIETLKGVTGAIRGETRQTMDSVTSASGAAPVCCGATGVNSAYTPVYITDYSFSRLVRADDLWGTNQKTFGTTGTGVNQFYGPHGVALDSSGRIYVADTYNCRIVRVNNISGAGWTTLGTCGSGAKQFSTGGLADLAVDSSGRVYVADPGNSRIVRFDDMTGTNWIAFGTAGSGTNQLSGAQGVAVDSSDRIYIADAGNRRLVRIDNMTGANWTTLTQSPVIGSYIYSFGSPAHVALDPIGRIEVADGDSVIRVDNMTGANWVSTSAGTAIQGLSIDLGATTFIAGNQSSGGPGLAMLDDPATGAGFETSNLVSQTGGIYAVPVPSPVPAVTIAPSTLTFSSQNTGTVSAAKNVLLTNFGSAPLDISKIAASAQFLESDNCHGLVNGGSNCTISVKYAPTTTGKISGTLTISDNAFTGTQTVALSATGTAPVAGIAPATLSFQQQAINTSSGAQYVYLSNSGTGNLTFSGSGIATTGAFAQTNNCASALAPKTSCTIAVTFKPTAIGAQAGTLTVTGNITPLSVALSGTGASAPPNVATTPESLIFPTTLVGVKSAGQTVTLKNSATTSVSIGGIGINGDFSRIGTCATSLGAGQSCIENVYFTPTAAGTRTGALTFTLSSGVITVGLTGTGTASATALLTVSPTSLAFNGYVVGDNPDQIITIKNPGGVPAGIASISMSGSAAFTFTTTCATTLAAGASCTVDVTFTPAAVGFYAGTLYVKESAGTNHNIPVSGTAVTGD